jgi:hypothetical protein
MELEPWLIAVIIICAIYIIGVFVTTILLYYKRYRMMLFDDHMEYMKIWLSFKIAIKKFPFFIYQEFNKEYLD